MKTKPLWRISAITTPEAGEAVAELFQEVFVQPAVSYTDIKTGRVTVSVYSPQPPQTVHGAIRAGLQRIRRCGLNTGAGIISLHKINRRDWAESWKRHFKPIQISSALLIRPSWSKRRPRKGQAVVVLDPGLSFGTGQHPTTAFCLQRLAARREQGKRQSVLDIGTGSGILAVAAAKLGCAPVHAFDSDPDAVRIARANARRNRVLDKIRFRRADLTRLAWRGALKHDVVCANLISSLLISQRRRIISLLKSDGMLVLAGILKTEFPQVQRAYERAGFKLAVSKTEKEWRSGAFFRT